jgi:hypothetical protein
MLSEKRLLNLSFLINNKYQIQEFFKKYNTIKTKANNESAAVCIPSFFCFFIVINAFILLFNKILASYDFQLTTFFIIIINVAALFVFGTKEDGILGGFKKNFLSKIFKNKSKNYLNEKIHENQGIVNDKSLKTIEGFHDNLNDNEKNIYSELIKEKYIDRSYDSLLYNIIYKNITVENNNEFINNKDIIMEAIGNLIYTNEKNFLIQLYEKKTKTIFKDNTKINLDKFILKPLNKG